MDFLGRPQNGPKWLPTMKMAEIQKKNFSPDQGHYVAS